LSNNKKTILHVEDDTSLQNLVRIALERFGGYLVRTAGDGPGALAIAREAAPDLVLMDLDLPGMNGIATLRALRELEGFGNPPVVFLTASGDPQVNAELELLGVRDILAKPFRPKELVQVIAKALERGSRDG
jgi:two-component system OmpR family response regulator